MLGFDPGKIVVGAMEVGLEREVKGIKRTVSQDGINGHNGIQVYHAGGANKLIPLEAEAAQKNDHVCLDKWDEKNILVQGCEQGEDFENLIANFPQEADLQGYNQSQKSH